MSAYEIESKRQIINVKKGRPIAYPFDKLTEVGMTFFVPESMKSFSAIYVATYRQNKRGKARFTASKGVKGEERGYRVQRVK